MRMMIVFWWACVLAPAALWAGVPKQDPNSQPGSPYYLADIPAAQQGVYYPERFLELLKSTGSIGRSQDPWGGALDTFLLVKQNIVYISGYESAAVERGDWDKSWQVKGAAAATVITDPRGQRYRYCIPLKDDGNLETSTDAWLAQRLLESRQMAQAGNPLVLKLPGAMRSNPRKDGFRYPLSFKNPGRSPLEGAWRLNVIPNPRKELYLDYDFVLYPAEPGKPILFAAYIEGGLAIYTVVTGVISPEDKGLGITGTIDRQVKEIAWFGAKPRTVRPEYRFADLLPAGSAGLYVQERGFKQASEQQVAGWPGVLGFNNHGGHTIWGITGDAFALNREQFLAGDRSQLAKGRYRDAEGVWWVRVSEANLPYANQGYEAAVREAMQAALFAGRTGADNKLFVGLSYLTVHADGRPDSGMEPSQYQLDFTLGTHWGDVVDRPRTSIFVAADGARIAVVGEGSGFIVYEVLGLEGSDNPKVKLGRAVGRIQ